MDNDQVRALCLVLLRADTEEEVTKALQARGLWDDPSLWRFYGDKPNNFRDANNQTERSDNAVVEKIVNAIDSTLIAECLLRGIDPESHQAPQSIHEAIAQFFEKPGENETPGEIAGWAKAKRGEFANRITVAATGRTGRDEGVLSLSIADMGEGQSPLALPTTILSLDRENKVKVNFVQGKFNMGGTAALRFCGSHNLQFVLSRRNPRLADLSDPSAPFWGFTVVRRENPEGGRRNSHYTYLAPVGATSKPRQGEVLRFKADSLPIFPRRDKAHARESAFGTLIKLYEYQTTGYSKSHVLRSRGLQERLDVLLPECALPVRIHECRVEGDKPGSFDNPLTGLCVRVEDGRENNLEFDPIIQPMRVNGEDFTVTIYAFKPGRAEAYARREGVIFTVNGQTHGQLPREFFKRKQVGMGPLWDSLLVIVDCSRISGRAREDLFMNSRDRLSDMVIRRRVEDEVESIVGKEPKLGMLKLKRKEEDIKSKLVDDKPLENVLRAVLKSSPTLSSLLLRGQRLPNPFDPGKRTDTGKFKGSRFPSFFRFKGKADGEMLERAVPINSRPRIQFETDAQDDYFGRKRQPGEFHLFLMVEGVRKDVADYSGPRLDSGIAGITIGLPPNCEVGDVLEYLAVINDDSRVEPFENRFRIRVDRFHEPHKGGNGKRTPRGERQNGKGGEGSEGFALPETHVVRENEWEKQKPPFDKHTALRVKNYGDATNPKWTFLVNGDNVCLKTEQKGRKNDPKLLEAQFVYGLILLGLAMIDDDKRSPTTPTDNGGSKVAIEDQIESFTRAAAAVLIPIAAELGQLEAEIED